MLGKSVSYNCFDSQISPKKKQMWRLFSSLKKTRTILLCSSSNTFMHFKTFQLFFQASLLRYQPIDIYVNISFCYKTPSSGGLSAVNADCTFGGNVNGSCS